MLNSEMIILTKKKLGIALNSAKKGQYIKLMMCESKPIKRHRRLNRADYYMSIAELTSKRGTCPRAQIGAIAIRDRRIIMSAYNGGPEGASHCLDVGCLMADGHCIRSTHAEANLIAGCARMGIALQDCDVFVTHEPCNNCLKLLISAGVSRVIYKYTKSDSYRIDEYEKLIWINDLQTFKEIE